MASKMSPAKDLATGDELDYDNQFDGENDDIEGDFDNTEGRAAPSNNLAAGAAMNAESQASGSDVDYSSSASTNRALHAAMLEQTRLMAHLVANSAYSADAHQRSIKALAAGSNIIEKEIHFFLKGSLAEFAADPSKARLCIEAGTLDHTRGTILSMVVKNGSNTMPASFMMQNDKINNLTKMPVSSQSGVPGVLFIPAKCKSISQKEIISSNESQAIRQFAEAFPNYTADNLQSELIRNPIKDGVVKVLAPEKHPVTECILTRYEAKGIKHDDFWSELNQKYIFDEAEVSVAVNDISKKLISENTAMSLDEISFPLLRANLSKGAKNDKSANGISQQWKDTMEIAAVIKAGHAEQELNKVGYITLECLLSYSPSPGSERK